MPAEAAQPGGEESAGESAESEDIPSLRCVTSGLPFLFSAAFGLFRLSRPPMLKRIGLAARPLR